MASSEISVGIVAASSTVRDHLRGQIAAAASESAEKIGLFTTGVVTEVERAEPDDRSEDELVQAHPDVILVHMEDIESTIRSLQYMSEVLPKARLVVTSETKDSEAVIATMQAGAREFLAEPVSSKALAEALERYINEKRRSGGEGEFGKIYSVIAPKGGTGGTTVAINLATSVATTSENAVSIVDLDSSKGDVAGYMNLRPEFSISHALAEVSRLDGVLLETYMCHSDGISVLSGLEAIGEIPDLDGVIRIMRVMAENYGYILVDLPRQLPRDLLQSVSELSEAVIVVLTPELASLWHCGRLLRALEMWGLGEKVRLVLNRWDSRAEISRSQIEKALEHPLYWTLPNCYADFTNTVNSGKALGSMSDSKLTLSSRELTRRLTGISQPEKPKGLSGLFFRLRGQASPA